MDNENINSNEKIQKIKLDELIRRKQEYEKNKKNLQEVQDPEKYHYEDIIRTSKRKASSKERVFNTAFCIEIKQEEERVMHMIKDPVSKPTTTWFEQVLEKERKMKRDENRIAQERLKMIDKRTRYSELIREIMSPTSKAKVNPEPAPIFRSSSKKETIREKFELDKAEKSKDNENPMQIKRIKPRSLSRKELSPYNSRMLIERNPGHRNTFVPTKADLN